MKQERIATVKATGEKYVVQQMDLRTNKVHTWGELMRFDTSGRQATLFEGVKSFPLEAVTITKDVFLTLDVLNELFEQSKRAHAEAIATGKLVPKTSRSRIKVRR
jgi:hypothetical protein